jgi:sRNA-binding carbon storage regulator CsrA
VCSHIRDIDETHEALIQLWGIGTEMRIWIESIDGDKARVSINADHELIEEVLDGQS